MPGGPGWESCGCFAEGEGRDTQDIPWSLVEMEWLAAGTPELWHRPGCGESRIWGTLL